MAFDKQIPMKIESYKIFDINNEDELEKVANIRLPSGFEYDSDFLYLLVRIVSSGEYYGSNKNGDYFPTQELENGYQTFADAHPFQEHRNKDVANSLGKIISFDWNPVMKTVEVLKAIDRKKSPEIVRGYEKGYMTDVSMGCRVPYTVCSICGNKASKRSDFCDHVKFHRNKLLGNGEKVFEINYKPRFHDSSVVLSGAERSAKAVFILNEGDFSNDVLFEKTASESGKVFEYTKLSEPELEKVARHFDVAVHPILQVESMEKSAGEEDEIFRKVAALEKEITGKILGIATRSDDYNNPLERFIELIKFMGDGRFTESTQEIADTLSDLADSRGVSRRTAFKTFLSIAELMGIQLYPTELSGIAREMTFGKNKHLKNSSADNFGITPQDFFRRSGNGVFDKIKSLPEIEDPSNLLAMYELAPMYKDVIHDQPEMFIRIVNKETPKKELLPLGFEDVIKEMLQTIYQNRSSKSDNIHARLMSYMGGGNILKSPSPYAPRDLKILSNPSSIGDLLDAMLYSNFQSNRPRIQDDVITKTASYYDRDSYKTTRSKVAKIYESSLFEKKSSLRSMDLDNADITMLMKVADYVDPGNYELFDSGFMNKYADAHTGGDVEKANAIRFAAMSKYAGDRESELGIKQSYTLPDSAVDRFFKYAYEEVNEELNKAAHDFRDIVVLDSFSASGMVKKANDLDVHLKDDLFLRRVESFFS